MTATRIDNLYECFDFTFVSFVAKHFFENYLEIPNIIKNSIKDIVKFKFVIISISYYFSLSFLFDVVLFFTAATIFNKVMCAVLC